MRLPVRSRSSHKDSGASQTEAIEQAEEDLGVGLGDPFEARDNGTVEPTEKLEALEAQRVGLRLHIGEGIARQPARFEVTEDVHRSLDRAGDHLFAAFRPGRDEARPLRVARGQFRAGRRSRHAPIVRVVPLGCAHLPEKELHALFVGKKLAVQVSRIPVE